MGNKYAITDPQRPYFITFSTVSCVNAFARPVYKKILIEILRYCQENMGFKFIAGS